MLLNNYYAYKKLMFSGYGSYNTWHSERIYFKSVSGSLIGGNNSPDIYAEKSYLGDLGYWIRFARCRAFPSSYVSSNTDSSLGVYFGTGTTPAALDDYKLEQPIEAGLSITNPSRYNFLDNGAGKWTFSASYVLTNTTAEDLNIYEIGIVTPLGEYSNNKYYPTLMEHTVLTEPITVPAGGVKLVTLTLTQNNVLNVEA